MAWEGLFEHKGHTDSPEIQARVDKALGIEMTEQDIREQIASLTLGYEYSGEVKPVQDIQDLKEGHGDLYREHMEMADQILKLIKDNGYVKISEDSYHRAARLDKPNKDSGRQVKK